MPRRTRGYSILVQPLLVGISDGPGDAETLDWSARYAGATGAPITVAHIVPRSVIWGMAAAQANSDTYIAERCEHFERELVRPLRLRGLHVDLRVELGDPAERLARICAEIDAELIVVGTRDHGALRDKLFRHFDKKLRDKTAVPVVVVPTEPGSAPAHRAS